MKGSGTVLTLMASLCHQQDMAIQLFSTRYDVSDFYQRFRALFCLEVLVAFAVALEIP